MVNRVAIPHYSTWPLNAYIWNLQYWKPINRLGYRDREPVESKKKKILIVGDSVMAGGGIHLESALPLRRPELGRRLRRRVDQQWKLRQRHLE